jgi:hypothetical protein
MASTYTLISSNVLSSSAASVTFSAIPSTYTDLVIRSSARVDPAGNTVQLSIQFNGLSTTIYSATRLRGNGSTASSSRSTSAAHMYLFNANADASTANTFSNGEHYIPNYAGTAQKTASGFGVTEMNSATSIVIDAGAGLANLTSAITSITLFDSGSNGNFMAGSSFYLYGIKNS